MKTKKVMWIFGCFVLLLFAMNVWAAPVLDIHKTIQLQREKDIADKILQNSNPLYQETTEASDAFSIVQTITAPVTTTGLAWANGNLWVSSNDNDAIYYIDTTGKIITSFRSIGTGPMGLSFDKGYLYNVDFLADKVYKNCNHQCQEQHRR